MSWKIVTAPNYDNVDEIEKLKNFLKIVDVQDNELITFLMASAGRMIETYTQRFLLTQTWDYYIDRYENNARSPDPWWTGVRQGHVGSLFSSDEIYIKLIKAPIASITSITYFDTDDVETTFAASKYFLDDVSEPPRIILNHGETWPSDGLRKANTFKIRVVGGYGAVDDIPEDLRNAFRMQVHYLYENREKGELRLSNTIKALLDPYVLVSEE